MPELASWQWVLGALCAFFIGMAKTGVPGLGILAVPLMVIAVGNARLSAGWLLPLLCAADVFAVVYYRRHAATRRLLGLVPWVVVGLTGGAAALGMTEARLRPLVGTIVLLMVVAHVVRRRRGDVAVPDAWPQSARYGVVAGFATMVANAAGPVMNMYLLSKRLPKEDFIATGAWFFLVINLSKVPVYAARHMLGRQSLTFDLVVLPGLAVGAVMGRSIFLRLPQKAFEIVVFCLTAASAVLLLLPARH